MQGLTTAAFSWTQIVIGGGGGNLPNFTYFGRQLFIRENKQILSYAAWNQNTVLTIYGP